MSTRLLITGGASGLGKALALTWAKHHSGEVKICIADIHLERGEQTVAELEKLGATAFFSCCDITDQAQIDSTVNAINTRWQGLDIVINNAGVATGGSLAGESIEQWQWVLDINLLGMVRVSKTVLPLFKQQGHGYYINIASQAGLTPIPLMGSYNATKAAVVGWSETMKLELIHHNIDVSVVCPSFFKTHLDESLRTSDPAVPQLMKKWFDAAPVSAEQVAYSIYQQAQAKTFLILTHKQGKQSWWLKRLLPKRWYLNIMLNKTKGMKRLVNAEAAQHPLQEKDHGYK